MPKGGLADDEEQKGSLADAAWKDQPGYVFRGALAPDYWDCNCQVAPRPPYNKKNPSQ